MDGLLAARSNSVRTTITARQDLLEGLVRWEIWGRLGWFEIKRRYRRTIIGPFWGAISIAVVVLAMGGVGSGLFHRSWADYLPFLASGMVAWIMIASMVTEGCNLFIGAEHLFRQMRFDYSMLAYALVWRNWIGFAHNLSVYAVIALLFAPHLLTPFIFLALPGLVLVGAAGAWMALLLGMLCLRFRDVQQLASSLMQLAIFVTPVFWSPDDLPGRPALVLFNPLHYLIDIVRKPLLGEWPSVTTYVAVIVIVIAGWMLTYVVFQRFRKRIAYWS
jgi:ABC-type polysaccharide/polyol phosphate export permease